LIQIIYKKMIKIKQTFLFSYFLSVSFFYCIFAEEIPEAESSDDDYLEPGG